MRLFHALFKKLWDKQNKKMFLILFNYLKTETRENSEKNYTNVSLDGRCSSIFWKNFYYKFNNKKKVFLKQIDFEKSEKIHSDSPEYYANFRYLTKVRTRKLREIFRKPFKVSTGIIIRQRFTRLLFITKIIKLIK